MEMTCYFIEPRTRKYVKGYQFLSFVRNLSAKYGKTNSKWLHTEMSAKCMVNKLAII